MKKDSILLRIILSIVVIILLIVPLTMIQSLILERQSYRNEAVNEINKSWADNQIFNHHSSAMNKLVAKKSFITGV